MKRDEDLLSIGEAASLKGISIKALRYYDHIGVLPPAHIDERSGYRYYSSSQLFDLDVILTCLELHIPLKEILEHRTPTGSLDLYGLLENGHNRAEERLRLARDSLARIDSCLEEMNQQQHLRTLSQPYQRRLTPGLCYRVPWNLTTLDAKPYLRTMTCLYLAADADEATPLYFQGLMTDLETTDNRSISNRIFAYVQVAHQPKHIPKSPIEFTSLPGGTWLGRRIEGPSHSGCLHQALNEAQKMAKPYLITEVWDDEIAEGTYVVELLQHL